MLVRQPKTAVFFCENRRNQAALKVLRCEINCFMGSRNQDVSFFNDVEWVNDLAFFTSVAQHLSKLNGQL